MNRRSPKKSVPMSGMLPRLLLCVLLCLFLVPGTTLAQRKGTLVTMDFKDVEIEDLVKTMAKLTGRNFMIDDRVRGKVTIISPTPISVEEAYRVFLAALEFRNLTIVKDGNLHKVMPNQNALKNPVEIYQQGERLPSNEQFVIRLVQLDFVDATEVTALLNNFTSSYGKVIAYAPTNMLIIGDSGNQINRLLEIVEEVDVEGNEQGMAFVKLEYSAAADIAKLVNEVYTAQAQQGQPTTPRRRRGRQAGASNVPIKLIPIDRLNSVIVIAPTGEMEDIKKLIKRLDVSSDESGGTIHVYYLSYADAEELASTLGGFTQDAGRQPGKAAAGAKPVGTVEFEGGVKITPDKSTNSLIIVSSPGDYQTLRALIRKLDIPRRQVFVEAVIMEVSVNKLKDMGLSWHALAPAGGEGGIAFGGQALGGVNTLTLGTTQPPAFPGLFLGGLAKPHDIGGLSVFGIGALLRALQTDESVNILSTPNILTSDNEDAEIVVGQNVPFITGQSTTTGGNTLTSVERQDVGITLKITPQINANNYVKLKIQQESSSVQTSAPAGLNVNQQGLITRKRSAKTTVVVKDRQTVVIGGLMSDQIDESSSKLPILGDLPIFGWFFKSVKTTSNKTNLLIFITPYVVNSQEDLRTYTQKREEFFHQFREDQYIEPLSEEYTFRRTYGPRVGESEVVDEELLGEDYVAPHLRRGMTSETTPGQPALDEEQIEDVSEEESPSETTESTAPPVPGSLDAKEEEDLEIPDEAGIDGEAPMPATEATVPATDVTSPAAPL